MPTSMRTKLANHIIFYSIFNALFIFIIRKEPNEKKVKPHVKWAEPNYKSGCVIHSRSGK